MRHKLKANENQNLIQKTVTIKKLCHKLSFCLLINVNYYFCLDHIALNTLNIVFFILYCLKYLEKNIKHSNFTAPSQIAKS